MVTARRTLARGLVPAAVCLAALLLQLASNAALTTGAGWRPTWDAQNILLLEGENFTASAGSRWYARVCSIPSCRVCVSHRSCAWTKHAVLLLVDLIRQRNLKACGAPSRRPH